jgi:hypothetical protein
MNVHEAHALTRHQQELIKVHDISRHADSLERIHEEQMRRVYAALDLRMRSAKRWGAVVGKISEIKQSETIPDATKQIASLVAAGREEDNKPEPERNLDDETASTATSAFESFVSSPQHMFSSVTKAGEDVALPHVSNPDRQSLKVSFRSPLSIEHPATDSNLPHSQASSTRDFDASSMLSSSDDSDDLTDLDDDELPSVTRSALSPSLRLGDIPQGQQEQQVELAWGLRSGAKSRGADDVSKLSVGRNATSFSRTQEVMKASLAEMLARYEMLKAKGLEDNVVELEDYDSNDDASSYADSLDDEEVDSTFEVPDAKEYLAGLGYPRRVRGIRRVPSMKEIDA